MKQLKRRALGSAFLFSILTACASQPPDKAARTLLRRYAQAECIRVDSVVRNIHIQTPEPGTVKVSDTVTGRVAFIHATPLEMRVAPGALSLFLREQSTLTEYRLNPVQYQTQVAVQPDQPPLDCR